MAELTPDDPQGMFNAGTHLGDDTVCSSRDGVQIAAVVGLAHDDLETA